jgi:2,4-dienoyl-CoA reductase-like NADH-dependent reductase (Old Yellow Enzyme family)
MYNYRHDQYGTDIKGRAKILLDIIQDIRQKAPGIHVTIKINCSDFFPGGLTPSEALKICVMLAQVGIDSIEVSGNGTSVAGIKAGQNEGYFLPFAKELHKVCRVPIILVGGHRSIECMERIINEEGIELLSLSRPLIREPNLVQRWQTGDTTPAKCVSCNACYQTPGHRCIFVKN